VADRPEYAFPHSAKDESRRLQIFEERLDPLTIRRLERLGIGRGARCLEIGGGRGSMARWLAERVREDGHVTVTDLELDLLAAIDLSNVEVLRHDLRTDTFAEESFDLVHTRAVLMHVSDDIDILRRMVSWLAPGGWLLLEEPDFGMWLADADPLWAKHPHTWHKTFPDGSLSRGRSLLRQVHELDLTDIGADAEVDIVAPGTPLAELHLLSMAVIEPLAVEVGSLSPDEAAAIVERPTQPDFLSCGFVHIGVWGRRPEA
jgi:trans-aconitate methyltransferase